MRQLTWVIIATQVALPVWPQVALMAAESAAVQEAASPVRLATAPAAPRVRVNRSVPIVEAPDCRLKFSAEPSDVEIFHARVFHGPIVSIGKVTSSTENKDLARALMSYGSRQDPDDAGALEGFLQRHPDSPRCISLLAGLAEHYRRTYQFSKALETWQEVWRLGRDISDAAGRKVVDESVSELASFWVTLGQRAELEGLMRDLNGRDMHGAAAVRISDARSALWQMQHMPERTFRCGPYSVACMRAALKYPTPFSPEIDEQTSTTNGTSLVENWRLSQRTGMRCQMARREPGAGIPLPAMVHWKLGHFSALTGFEKGRYKVDDSTLGQGWISAGVLDEEASGYFLVPEGRLPAGWSPVTEEEGQTIWGRSWPAQSNPNNVTPRDKKTCQPPCCPMAQYAVHLMRVSLNISDTPVGYEPPRGPGVNFRVTYNELEPNQPATFNYSNLGEGWTFDWLSYIQDTPANPNANVTLQVRGGGAESFTYLSNNVFAVQSQSQMQLIRTSTNSYELLYPDGSMDLFTNADSASPRQVFMTQTVDPSGNAVSFVYDSNFRMVAVVDAIGQVTTNTYGSTNPGDPLFYQITRVTDPFGRYATFQYNASGQLTNITDILGISSAFTYGEFGGGGFHQLADDALRHDALYEQQREPLWALDTDHRSVGQPGTG